MIPHKFQELINLRLRGFFEKKKQAVIKWDSRLWQLIEQIQEVTLRGGDRLRPYMCSLGYQINGEKPLEPILPALLALELFHTFALIHDDIMDEGELRRGGPTIHAYFTQNLRNPQKAASLAILAGDLTLVWAEELFNQINQSGLINANQAKAYFHKMQEEVIYGQTLDIWGKQDSTVDQIISMYQLKSARYAIEKPLLIGAGLIGVSSETLTALSKYGEKVGLAFQYKDDLLGVFGEAKTLGKSTTSDITEGKWTILMAYAYTKLDATEKLKLLNILQRKPKTAAEITWVKEMLVKSGAKDCVEKEMRKLIEQAKRYLKSLPDAQTINLKEIADFVIERNI